MLLNIKINKETLEINIDDSTFIINKLEENNNIIELELSKPDPEIEYPWQQ
jgi:hypothetical protein